MKCADCGHSNPEDLGVCEECGQPLDSEDSKTGLHSRHPSEAEEVTKLGPASPGPSASDESATDLRSHARDESPTDFRRDRPPSGGGGRTSSGSNAPSSGSDHATDLIAYQSFGNRFEILELLGEGGMGRVYKAWDRELEKIVALKTIRTEHAKNPEILKRFKQELLLARQITHKHVIRIHDMGEAEGVKFFTMEFIIGESLKDVVRKKGKLAAEGATSIAKQILGALDEAHSQGVIHRDLKPQNIMIDPDGMAHVMDFGIARSMQDTGMTATGTVMGTPDYMSPEQARGTKAAEQSDLFSFGVILYEMLSGELPYGGDTAASRVMARITEKPRPIRDHVPDIPRYLANIVHKCLEIDPSLRYKSARDVLDDIEREQVDRSITLRVRKTVARRKGGLAAAAVTLTAITVAVYLAVTGGGPPAPTSPATTLAVAPFTNATNDPSLDWLGTSLAEILTTEIGQSERLRTVTSDRVSQILSDLRVRPGSRIDPATLARVAEFSNAQMILSGQYLKLGEQIRIDATLHDLNEQRTVPLKAEAPGEAALLETIGELARSVQENLGVSRDIVEELRASAFRPSSDSIQAQRFYHEGLQLLRQGNNLGALERFEAAQQEDPEFALACARLGQTYAGLGYEERAEELLRKAVDLARDLAPQERYVILAEHARVQKDYAKAIEHYQNLSRAMPEDLDVHYNLAQLFESTGAFDQARRHLARILERDPNHFAALLSRGRVEFNSGNPQDSFEFLNRALSLSIQLENQEARGAALNAMGVAYRVLNRPQEALRHYEEALALQREVGDKRGAASTLGEIAFVHQYMGNGDEALLQYREALALQREIGDKTGTPPTLVKLGNLYHDRGQYDKALETYKETLQLVRESGNESREAVCLNNIGTVYFDTGQFSEARTYFDLALRLREKSGSPGDIAETVHNLGEIATATGSYNEALDYYLRALELSRKAGDKLGTAIESHSLGKIFQYQGRFGAALNAREDALGTVRGLKEGSFWLAHILSWYGSLLNEMGRFDEAAVSLKEALELGRELQNQEILAQTLNFQADGFFYQDELESARRLYQEALGEASEETDARLALHSNLYLAAIGAREATAGASLRRLEELVGKADGMGFKNLSTEGSIWLAEALMNANQHPRAREELDATLVVSERLDLRIQQAKIDRLLARLSRLSGNEEEARRGYGAALAILEDVRKEAGTDDFLRRADVKSVYQESTRWATEDQKR